jgi:hypothetical protein
LDLTLAIIDEDRSKFAQVQRQLRDMVMSSGSPMPEHVSMPINELKGLRGSIFRQLISRALQTSIFFSDEDAAKKLLKFATKKKIIVHVFQSNINFVVDQRNFNLMALLSKHSILLRQKITKMKPLLAIAFKYKFMQAKQATLGAMAAQ